MGITTLSEDAKKPSRHKMKLPAGEKLQMEKNAKRRAKKITKEAREQVKKWIKQHKLERSGPRYYRQKGAPKGSPTLFVIGYDDEGKPFKRDMRAARKAAAKGNASPDAGVSGPGTPPASKRGRPKTEHGRQLEAWKSQVKGHRESSKDRRQRMHDKLIDAATQRHTEATKNLIDQTHAKMAEMLKNHDGKPHREVKKAVDKLLKSHDRQLKKFVSGHNKTVRRIRKAVRHRKRLDNKKWHDMVKAKPQKPAAAAAPSEPPASET